MATTDDLKAFSQSLLKPETDPDAEAPEPTEEQEAPAEPPDGSEEDAAEASEADEEEEAADDDAETDAADQEEPDEPRPETYRVKVDGNEIEVTLDDLKRAYSGDAHIQRGMQEAAEAKKQAKALLDALQSEQQRFTEFANLRMQEGFKQPPKAPDQALAKKDPIRYIEALAEYQESLAEYQAEQAEIQRYAQAQKAASDEQMRARFMEQERILAQHIPEFGNPETAPKAKEALRKAGEFYGFSADELGSVVDARAVRVLNDAAKWRQLQSAKANPKKAEPPKNVKPAAKRQEPPQLARKRAIEKAKASGDLRDFAALLLKDPSS